MLMPSADSQIKPLKPCEEPELVLLAEQLADSPVTAYARNGQNVTPNSLKFYTILRKAGLLMVCKV